MNTLAALRRPLLLCFFLASTVSYLTTHKLSLRVLIPAMLYWSLVPLLQIVALMVVCRHHRRTPGFATLIDTFFKGNMPWLLWLIGLCAIWSVLSPQTRSSDWAVSILWLLGGLVFAVIWSIHIDFRFFQAFLRETQGAAIRHLAMHRLIAWSAILTILGGPTIWSDIVGKLW